MEYQTVYKFHRSYKNNEGQEEATLHEFIANDLTWRELMEQFARFVRGAGYQVPIDFLKEE